MVLPEDNFERVNCLLCGQGDTLTIARDGGPAEIVKCRRDGLLYLNPRPKDSRVTEFNSNYVRQDNLEMFDAFRGRILKREADAIRQIQHGGNLLDVGCATGKFFENFPAAEWRLYGIDTSATGIDVARARYNADVFCGDLQDAGYPSNFFDVVTVLDTLYFFKDPKAELLEIKRVLKSTGLLAIEIPGLAYRLIRNKGPFCWLLDRKWSNISPRSWHLYYFSPRTLRLLLGSVGLRVIRSIPEQASLGREGIARRLNDIHFGVARVASLVTRGTFSIAGKQLFLIRKGE